MSRWIDDDRMESYKQDHINDKLAEDAEWRERNEWAICDTCGTGIHPNEAVMCEECYAVIHEECAVPLDLKDCTWICRNCDKKKIRVDKDLNKGAESGGTGGTNDKDQS